MPLSKKLRHRKEWFPTWLYILRKKQEQNSNDKIKRLENKVDDLQDELREVLKLLRAQVNKEEQPSSSLSLDATSSASTSVPC